MSIFSYSTGQRRKVRKIKGWGVRDVRDQWIVTNHPLGPKRFATWREAYDYAAARVVMMN